MDAWKSFNYINSSILLMEKIHKPKSNAGILFTFAMVVISLLSVIEYVPNVLSQTLANYQLISNVTTGNNTSANMTGNANMTMSATDSSMTGDDESPTEGSGAWGVLIDGEPIVALPKR